MPSETLPQLKKNRTNTYSGISKMGHRNHSLIQKMPLCKFINPDGLIPPEKSDAKTKIYPENLQREWPFSERKILFVDDAEYSGGTKQRLQKYCADHNIATDFFIYLDGSWDQDKDFEKYRIFQNMTYGHFTPWRAVSWYKNVSEDIESPFVRKTSLKELEKAWLGIIVRH